MDAETGERHADDSRPPDGAAVALGVDEAGKGPVLGAMFAAAVVAHPSTLPDGVDDSKRLAPARRESLAASIRNAPEITVAVASVPPARIDDPTTDMNTLTVAVQATAIRAAVARASVPAAGISGVLDAGDVDERRFRDRVTERVPADLALVAEHGADAAHGIVAAASVVAKVERDAHVAALAAGHAGAAVGADGGRERDATPADLGSGYPSDPATRSFLRAYADEHADVPPCARRSWSTCRDVLAAAEQSALDRF